jgi:hypothetical protein
MEPRPPPRLKPPEELAREFEERQRLEAIRLQRWRRRRRRYLVAVLAVGTAMPALSLLLAGSISAGRLTDWLARGGWPPLLLTVVAGGAGAALVFTRGWGVALGMLTYGGAFMLLVALLRGVLGGLVPAMPGLVAFFVMTGALVGHLTALEDGD